MTSPDLWGIRKASVRTFWPREARDFTPWLYRNLHLLGEALGVNLRQIEFESSVGKLSLDILAEDLERNCKVAIENQLKVSDHSHLGQLLTYAAGHNAYTMIWVSTNLRDEHHNAINWYNQWSRDEIHFYGVNIRVSGINDSFYALKFVSVAFPRNWPKERQAGSKQQSPSNRQYAEQGSAKLIQLELDELVELGSSDESQVQFQSDQQKLPHIKYLVSLHGPDMELWTYLFIHGNDKEVNVKVFEELEKDKEELEKNLKVTLFWDRSQEYRYPVIALKKKNGWIGSPPEELAEIRAWMLETLPRFREVFNPRLKKILAELDTE